MDQCEVVEEDSTVLEVLEDPGVGSQEALVDLVVEEEAADVEDLGWTTLGEDEDVGDVEAVEVGEEMMMASQRGSMHLCPG